MTPTSKRHDGILEFPCKFPLKVMGYNRPDFRPKVLEIVQRHAPGTTDNNITQRYSADQNYISLTVTIIAQNRPQLDDLYRELTSREEVLVAL